MATSPEPPDAEDLFSHQPLNHNEPSIRLLHLLPDESSEGPIQCRIFHATLDAEYVCLSYMWGPEERAHRVLIDGKPFYVRQNLFDFLGELRRRKGGNLDGEKALWIDALCIDQSNTSERNHQVQQMGKIFSHAHSVILWLGAAEPLLPLLSFLNKSPVNYTLEEWKLVRRQETQTVITDYLFANPYWSRAWITQELGLARQTTVWIDEEEFDISKLLEVPAKFFIKTWDTSPMNRFASQPKELRGAPLVQLVSHFREKQCSEPRDRIFSLLSLCGDGSQLKVDYNLPELDLAAQVLSSCREHVCLCTASAILQSLRSPKLLEGFSGPHDSFPYIEFDIHDPFLRSSEYLCVDYIDDLNYEPQYTSQPICIGRKICLVLGGPMIWRHKCSYADERAAVFRGERHQNPGTKCTHQLGVLKKRGNSHVRVWISLEAWAKTVHAPNVLCVRGGQTLELTESGSRPKIKYAPAL